MSTELPPASIAMDARIWRGDMPCMSTRALPEEIPVALTYDRATFAVMMASPGDVADFAYGFSLSEGIIAEISEIADISLHVLPDGIECRMSLTPARRDALEARRRRIAGPMGCGICGLESLQETRRALPRINSAARLAAVEIAQAMARMAALQTLNRQTRAVHAAALFDPTQPEILLREDVGRHNALDKLIGAACRVGLPAINSAVLLTSRVSLDLIQKATAFGAPILVAVSVPTALAVREADVAGLTLVAVARGDGFEVFTHPERVIF